MKATHPLKKKTDQLVGLGRRKTSIARVRLSKDKGHELLINNKPFAQYFPTAIWQRTVLQPLSELNLLNKFGISIKVSGGGLTSQAEACRLGIARALLSLDENYKKILRSAGFMTRDPRAKERKKPGLKRARRAPQWSKR